MRTVGDESGDTRQVEEEAAGGVTQGSPWHLQLQEAICGGRGWTLH